ncbi:hypothetical protein FVB32_08655 [Flagellimonas hymeniacidonis]|uniref:Uncharacterized protein n=1 Tax=Flagellimonas hymeniacidonis TaxID=2603628 RepID=A0A5C8VC11_9FLAO|nr:hypothetical protein [Flagellimonas hymeniacidonis]TXN38348.1 hypothetical protein FVB32_08655 [Flagellimonas hymeniacidonis]
MTIFRFLDKSISLQSVSDGENNNYYITHLMKNVILIACCILLSTSMIQAQDNTPSDDQIEMKVRALGYRFYKDGERLTWKELVSATESVKKANALIKRAKSQKLLSNILAFSGGALIGVPLGQKSAHREPTWELAYLGGGIALISLHLSFRTFNNVNKGIDSYNIAMSATAQYQFQPEFRVIADGKGFGLAMRF